ncbi:MAG: dipicolinate synthase subunit DpsA [Lachnospiraceae bacterium]|nr:dipicolinate synthase subunit DpsA [Lachnospiraceae bacterium]
MNDFCFIGGDLRQKYMLKELRNMGYSVESYGLLEEDETHNVNQLLKNADIYILPIPFSKDNVHINTMISNKTISLADFCNNVSRNTKVFGGMFTNEFRNCMEEKSIQLYDFMGMETVAIQNSIATAEGAIANAMMESPLNIHGSRCLVLGYGRCAKTLANKLKGLDANVYVTARSENALASAGSMGLNTFLLKDMGDKIGRFDFVFNTIPNKILLGEHIRKMKKTAIIIDIASNPGGVDFIACEEYGICARHCLSIPGKYAPMTSAKILNKAMLGVEL